MFGGFGMGAGGWVLMTVFWIVLVAVIVWAIVRLVPSRTDDVREPRRSAAEPPEKPREILDRRLASGEIDVETYEELRSKLSCASRREGGVITMRAKRFAIVAAAVAAVAAVGAVVALAAGGGGSWNAGWGMMGGRYVYRPAQPTQVHTLAAARSDAQQFANRLGLRVDEVMQFRAQLLRQAGRLERQRRDRGAGRPVDRGGVDRVRAGDDVEHPLRDGPVGRLDDGQLRTRNDARPRRRRDDGRLELDRWLRSGHDGRLWLRLGGMMGGYGSAGSSSTAPAATSVSLAQAHTLAQRWLDRNEAGVKVESGGDAFPGYYTLETLKAGKITGMISVNASSGAVWPHWWHGAFIAKS